mmetsp:Transcript_10323/g.22420  ORF Transcript_10323/g.22420 Transcript_10323/m.22420 type:complete len:222 (+) Transcript_10323:664-1329(+)
MSSNINGPKFPVLYNFKNVSHRFNHNLSSLTLSFHLLPSFSRQTSMSSVGPSKYSLSTYWNTPSRLAQCNTYSQNDFWSATSSVPSRSNGRRFVAPYPNHASGLSPKKNAGGVIPGTSMKNDLGFSFNRYSVMVRVLPGLSSVSGADPFRRRAFPRCFFLTLNDPVLILTAFFGIAPRCFARRRRDMSTEDLPTLATPTVSARLFPLDSIVFNSPSYNWSK